MAVAVKTSPGARSSGSLASPAILSLIGLVYLLGCLGIVFGLIPSLWWAGWASFGLGGYTFVGGSLLLLVCLAVGVGLLWTGVRLLGPNPPAGIRAGVFVNLVGLLLVVLLTRWVSLWTEHLAYDTHTLPRDTGAIITGIAGVVLLLGWLWLFFQRRTQDFVLALEHGGWFHATVYKGNQGIKVRRGTIAGVLLLVGAGIYTLLSHGTLKRGPADWALNLPFTGEVIVTSIGDDQQFLAELDASKRNRVQVIWPGASGFQPKEFLSADAFRDRVKQVVDDLNAPASFKDKVNKAAEGNSVDFIVGLNKAIHAELEPLMEPGLLREDVSRRLQEVDNRTSWADISPLIEAVKQEVEVAATAAEKEAEGAGRAREQEGAAERQGRQRRLEGARKAREKSWLFKVPTADLVVDRYALQSANAETDPSKHVRVGLNRNPNFKLPEGAIVSATQFDQQEVRVYTLLLDRVFRGVAGKQQKEQREQALENLRSSKDGAEFRSRLTDEIEANNPPLKNQLEDLSKRVRDEFIPARQPLAPATGTTRFASIPLLPSVQFTVPLLLLAGALWLAWRVVNMPSFADFLIATEAEMNKVSWTTQRKLGQDTVVVLVVVVLMAGFLFTTDYFWKTVLSWKPIGVLHIPQDAQTGKEKLDEKRW